MGLIGGAIGGVASAAGAIASGNLLKKNLQDALEAREGIQDNMAFAKAHMEKGMYAQPGQSASFNAAQTSTLEALRQANKEAAQNVTGGASQAAKAAAKANAVDAAGNMMTQAALQNEQQREAAYKQGQSDIQSWQQQDTQMMNYINQARTAQAQNIQAAAGGVAQAANSLPW